MVALFVWYLVFVLLLPRMTLHGGVALLCFFFLLRNGARVRKKEMAQNRMGRMGWGLWVAGGLCITAHMAVVGLRMIKYMVWPCYMAVGVEVESCAVLANIVFVITYIT
jgi:hypothetical protein